MIVPVPCQTCARKRHIDHFICDECGRRLRQFDGEWQFCPYCGQPLDMDGLNHRVRKARKLHGG
jgi:predicted amidophosphoribosyltransferase